MSVSILNSTAGISAKTVDLLESDQSITGLKTFDRGTSAPFAVANSSAAKVTNLDADKLDGQEGSYYLSRANHTGTLSGQFGSGSVGTVAVQVGDTDVGLYSSGTNALDVATNGVKAMGIDSTQFIDSPTQPRCSAYHNTTQAITTGSALSLNAEDYDVGTMHDTVTNNTRVTVPTGGDGLYLVQAYVQATSAGTGDRYVTLRKNGTTNVPGTERRFFASTRDSVVLSTVLTLSAADYLEIVVDSGDSSSWTFGAASGSNPERCTRLTMVKLW